MLKHGVSRMKIKNKLMVVLAFTLASIFAVPSFADGPGWTVASKVTRLVVVADGGINVRLSPELSGCTSQNGYGQHYASVPSSHAGIKIIQSNLLAAYVSGADVSLYLSDNTCKVGEMVLGGTYN